ncbi:PPE domain-containing protein [Amycolatopsis sp. H6(2020)]|nr:PPE domain-containing protein [Amycolatopsis sp. H6(2020)]
MNAGWNEEFRHRLLRPRSPVSVSEAGLELRPATGVPVTVWENVSHERMTAEVSANANPSAVAESAQEWLRIGEELQQHERALTRAIEESRADWQGAGGTAARRHLTAVARWLGTTARGATLAGRQQQAQAQALEEVRRRMAANPPVEFSAEAANARLQGITDPVEYARQLAEDTRVRTAQEAAHAEAVRIMGEFDRALGQAVVTPFFTPPPELPGVSVRSGLGWGGDSVAGVVGSPVERLAGAPVAGVPGSPVERPAGAPVAGVPGSPVERPAGATVAGLSGSPVERPAGVPVAGVPGTPVERPAGVPVAGVPGVPVERPAGAPPDSVAAAAAGPGSVPPVPQPPVASGAGGGSLPDSTKVSGMPPVAAAGVPPLPPNPAAAGRQPGSGIPAGSRPLSRSDSAAGGVPPLPPPDSTGGTRSDPAVRGGIPPLLPPDSAGGTRSDPAVRGGVPPLLPPDPALPEGASPFPRPGSPLPGGVPLHPDSTAASGAGFVPPPDPAVTAGVPPLPPDPASAGGTAGPGRVPPGPAASGAAGRVPPIAVPRTGGPAFGPGVRGGRRRDDTVRTGGPRAQEPSGGAPDETPGGEGLRPPTPQQGAQPPLTGLPRAGGKPAEDEEHRVADYLEADPELFAAEQPVVPPTLGDWKKNKNWRKKP